jgi:hypothetical protein
MIISNAFRLVRYTGALRAPKHRFVVQFSSSTADDIVKTDLEVETGIATVILNRPPANSLSLEMCVYIRRKQQLIEDKKDACFCRSTK